MKKIRKKDYQLYESMLKKIEEITENPQHYKPLKHDLKGRRRVHIEKSFVLVFQIDEDEKKVTFLDLCHHDKVYRKR